MKKSSLSILLGIVAALLLYFFYQLIFPAHYPIPYLNVVKLTKSINRFISLEKKADLVGSEHVGKIIFTTLNDNAEEVIETLSHTDKREVLHSLDHKGVRKLDENYYYTEENYYYTEETLPSDGSIPKGVRFDVTDEYLIQNGFQICYEDLYSQALIPEDFLPCSDKGVVFVGAKLTNGHRYELGAFASSTVLTKITLSSSIAELDSDLDTGVYWYNVPDYSFGFAQTSNINLMTADVEESQFIGVTNVCTRLSWHWGSGGWRAGCNLNLNGSDRFKKVIYFRPDSYNDNSNAYQNGYYYYSEAVHHEVPCPKGFKSTSIMSDEEGEHVTCISCPAGKYQYGAQCADCPPGKYSRSGSIVCKACSAGYYSLASASKCSICPAGTYSFEDASTTCTPCPLGQYSFPGSLICSGCANK